MSLCYLVLSTCLRPMIRYLVIYKVSYLNLFQNLILVLADLLFLIIVKTTTFNLVLREILLKALSSDMLRHIHWSSFLLQTYWVITLGGDINSQGLIVRQAASSCLLSLVMMGVHSRLHKRCFSDIERYTTSIGNILFCSQEERLLSQIYKEVIALIFVVYHGCARCWVFNRSFRNRSHISNWYIFLIWAISYLMY